MLKRSRRFLVTLLSIFSLLIILFLITIIVLFSMSKKFWYISPIIIFSICIVQLFFGIWIFFSKRIMEVKASWNLVLLIPIFGIFIYLIFGTIPFKLLSHEKIKESKSAILKKHDYHFTEKYLDETNDQNIRFLYNTQGNPLYLNNDILFLENYDFLNKSLEIINNAKESINIQYYIIADSSFLKVIINALVKKRREGVKIKFMYDYVGSHNRFPKKMIKEMINEGIEVAVFNPPIFTKLISMINFRSHRKGIIVDNKYCLTGGSNIADEYLNIRKKYFNWNDTNFLIEGEIVNSINLTFLYDWYFNSNKRKDKGNIVNDLKELKIHKSNNEIKMINIDAEPYSEYKVMLNTILSWISKATNNITIVTPYFALNNSIIDMLNYKSLSGIKVNIVIPGRPDNKSFIIEANKSMFPKLSDNINVYLYDGFIHTKAMLIDNDIFVGTNNMDYRSLIINFETMFLIRDNNTYKKFNDYIQNIIINNSLKINIRDIYNNDHWYKKLKMKLINIIYPLI